MKQMIDFKVTDVLRCVRCVREEASSMRLVSIMDPAALEAEPR